jgi:hypothetical protein
MAAVPLRNDQVNQLNADLERFLEASTFFQDRL